MPDISRLKNKLVGPAAAIILLILVLLLALNVSFWFQPTSKAAAGDSELIVTVGKPAAGKVINPKGGMSGGATGTIVIPKLEPGEYSLVLRGLDNGESHFVIQALSHGESAFWYADSLNMTAGSEWLVRLHVGVLDGLQQDIQVTGYEPAAPVPGGADSAARRVEVAAATVESARSAASERISWASEYLANQWVAVGSVVLLTLVLAVIWKKR